jgi:hypothetical protein
LQLKQAGVNLMHINQTTWRMLGKTLRDLMPVNAEATNELQALVLRLAVKDADRIHTSGIRRASKG